MIKIIVLAMIIGISITACSRQAPSEIVTVSENVDELSRLIKMPCKLQSARWQLLKFGKAGGGIGPEDWGVIAIINVSPGDKQKIVKQSPEINIDTVFSKTFVPDWFPEELRSLWSTDKGGLRLMAKAKDAGLFYSSPLQNGFILPFGNTGSIMIYLYTR